MSARFKRIAIQWKTLMYLSILPHWPVPKIRRCLHNDLEDHLQNWRLCQHHHAAWRISGRTGTCTNGAMRTFEQMILFMSNLLPFPPHVESCTQWVIVSIDLRLHRNVWDLIVLSCWSVCLGTTHWRQDRFFLEMFSGSAKLSQSASMQGLRVGTPIDLRTGCGLLRKAMEVIERKQPKIIHSHGTSLWSMEPTPKYQQISANGRYLRYPHPPDHPFFFFYPPIPAHKFQKLI